MSRRCRPVSAAWAGPAGSADALLPGASVESQFAAAATFSVLQIAAAASATALLLLGPAWGSDPVGERGRRLGLRWSNGRALILGGAPGAAAGYVAILAGAGFVSALVLGGLHITGRPTVGGSIPDPLLLAGDYLMSISAGIGEELLLLAIPFALATRAGWKPWAVIVLREPPPGTWRSWPVQGLSPRWCWAGCTSPAGPPSAGRSRTRCCWPGTT